MAMAMEVTRNRLQRLVDERNRTNEKMEDVLRVAEEEERSLNESENETLSRYRNTVGELETEIGALTEDLERAERSQDVSRLIRVTSEPAPATNGNGTVVYRTFGQYARDQLITRFPQLQAFVSDGRLVTYAKESAGQRYGTAGTTMGTASLTWAFSAAAG